MIPLKIYVLLFAAALLLPKGVQAQLTKNERTMKHIYEMVQKNSTTSGEIKALTPKVKWDKFKNDQEIDERYTITFIAIMKNKWHSLEFNDLAFLSERNNTVIVSGKVSGKEPAECEYISNTFKHSWTLQDEKIIGFSEH
jgi:hypothetical protein